MDPRTFQAMMFEKKIGRKGWGCGAPAGAHEALEARFVQDLHKAIPAAAAAATAGLAAAGSAAVPPISLPGLVKGIHAAIEHHLVVRAKDVRLQLCGRGGSTV